MRYVALIGLSAAFLFGCGGMDSVAERTDPVVDLPPLTSTADYQLLSREIAYYNQEIVDDVTGDGQADVVLTMGSPVYPGSIVRVLRLNPEPVSGDRVLLVPSSPESLDGGWKANYFTATDLNLDGQNDLVVVFSSDLHTEIAGFFGPISGELSQDDADWTLTSHGGAGVPTVFQTPLGDASGILACLLDPRSGLAKHSCVGWPLPVEPGVQDLEDAPDLGGFILPKALWRHEALNSALDFPLFSYYFGQVAANRCRLDDNEHRELISGTFYKLGVTWNFDAVARPGRDDVGPTQEIVVATESSLGVDGYTPNDMVCVDFDGDGFDEVFVGTRSSINAADGEPGHVFMLDPPFADLQRAWNNRKTVTEGPFVGRQIASLGDIDGDGLGDACISASGSYFGNQLPQHSEVRILLSSQGLEPALIIEGEDDDDLECRDGTGDVDGDGLIDFLLYATGRDSVWLVTGKRLRELANQ